MALALLAIFAYSLYSLLSPSVVVPSGWGALPLSSGVPALSLPPNPLSGSPPSPLLEQLAYLIYLIFAFLAWLFYQIARLLSLLARVPLLPAPPNHTATAGIPPTSTTPPIGGEEGLHQIAPATTTPAFSAILTAVVVAIAAIALALGSRTRQAKASSDRAIARTEEAAPSFTHPIASPPRPYSPEVPSLLVDLPPPVKPELIKWPLAEDVPPVWPLGVPLRVEAAHDGVKLTASCCAEALEGALVITADTACDVWISAEYEDRREALRVRFSDLHKEVANSFFERFRSYPRWMTAREILRSRNAPADVVEVVERAAYSNLPISYQDFAKYYRWLIHEGAT